MYDSNCTKCVVAVVCEKKFCLQHSRFETVAKQKRLGRKENFKQNSVLNRGGIETRSYGTTVNVITEEENELQYNIFVTQENQTGVAEGYFDRGAFTYGEYVIVKPCGIILSQETLFRSEGIVATWAAYNRLYAGVPATDRPPYIWTDKSCAIQRYGENHRELIGLQNWSNTRFLVDRFHGGQNHNRRGPVNFMSTYCWSKCEVSKMPLDYLKQHFPGLVDEKGDTQIGNSEAAEQMMNKVGAFSHCILNMRHDNKEFFICWLTYDMNQVALSKMIRKKLEPYPLPNHNL
jgi:hypothetical protein